MEYELYVDVLFLVNFFMDYISLLFVWKVLHCDTKHIWIVLGATLGSLIYCVLVILPIPNALLEFILFHLVINTCMIQVGLKIKKISLILKALILLYIGAFFMGGIITSLYQYVSVGSLFLFVAIVGYYLSLGMWNFLKMLHKRNSHLLKVELWSEGRRIEVTGLIDTGNGLRDPLTGLPVSVIERTKAADLLGEGIEGVRYIPYQSIGKSQGLMPVVRIDEMRIVSDDIQVFKRPIIGISEEKISAGGGYELILNSNLF